MVIFAPILYILPVVSWTEVRLEIRKLYPIKPVVSYCFHFSLRDLVVYSGSIRKRVRLTFRNCSVLSFSPLDGNREPDYFYTVTLKSRRSVHIGKIFFKLNVDV